MSLDFWMKSAIRNLSAEILLRETRWLNGLARQLVSDPHRAQDVAQDAWVALAEHRGPVSELRPWLRRVTWNLAYRLRSRESQRAHREAAAARSDAQPSAAETVECIRVQHRVVAALLKLDEPYRSTVALRFFDGLPPRKIAARMSVPVNTVHSRLQRALAAMRRDLDREFSDRRAWVIPLLARFGTTPAIASAALIGMLMKAKVAAVAVCLLIASGVWLILANETPPPGTRLTDGGASLGSSLRADLGTEEQIAGDGVERSLVVNPPERVTGDLVVRVLWRDDLSPVPGLTLRLGRGHLDAFSRTTPELTTDAEGIARASDLDPGAYRIHAARLMPTTSAEVVSGRLGEVEVLLDRHGHFNVRVTDEGGAPIPGAEVFALDSGLMGKTHVGRTDSEGRIELDAAGPNVSVYATMDGRGTSEVVEIVSFPGDVMDVALTLGQGALELRGWVTDGAGKPVTDATVAVQMPLPKPWTLNWDEGGESYDTRPVVITDAEGRFRISNVLPGEVVCEARAEGYKPTVASKVLAEGDTSELEIVLEPGARVVGVVRDVDDEPVSGAAVNVYWHLPRTQPESLTYTDAHGRFSLPSLNPGSIDLSASHPEHGQVREKLEVLAGETRFWEPRLVPAGVIEGQVVNDNGEPLAGLTVEVVGGDVLVEPRVLTGEDGRFRALRTTDHAYRVTVMEFSAAKFLALARFEDVRPGADPLNIMIPNSERPSAFLSGRVVRPPGFEHNLVRLWAFGDRPGLNIIRGARPDGTFRIGPVPPGRYAVESEPYKSPLGGFSFPEVDLGPGEEIDLGVLEIPSPTWLEIDIRYQDGGEPSESYVQLINLEEFRSSRDSRWIRGAMLPQTYKPSRYRLRLFDLHHLPWVREVELIDGQTTRVEAIVERARPARITLALPTGIAAPESLQIALHREGSKDERISQLFEGERLLPVGLGTYLVEIQDESGQLEGSVRFTVSDLQGPELRVELPAR